MTKVEAISGQRDDDAAIAIIAESKIFLRDALIRMLQANQPAERLNCFFEALRGLEYAGNNFAEDSYGGSREIRPDGIMSGGCYPVRIQGYPIEQQLIESITQVSDTLVLQTEKLRTIMNQRAGSAAEVSPENSQ